MKTAKHVAMVASLCLLVLLSGGCKKKKTTGHIYVTINASLEQWHNGSGCCTDPSIPPTIEALVYLDNNEVFSQTGSNNSTIDCGEWNPGNYKIRGKARYISLGDNSGIAPCGNCVGGATMTNYADDKLIQVVENQDQTIVLTID